MNVLTFNTWDVSKITVDDPGLKRYISIEPRFVPKTGGKYAGRRFGKSKTFVVERLINRLMVPGHKGDKHYRTSGFCTGKAANTYNIVHDAFKLIEQRTNENPVKVFVKAIENAAPREEIISIEYGGARYPKAVECAPQRRIDVALRYICFGAFNCSFNAKKKLAECLADEIIAAFRLDQKSAAISKKLELERQADASR